jgi:hypothetical protein
LPPYLRTLRACLAVLGCALATGFVWAAEGLTTQFSAELGAGFESQTSPLVQLSPTGSLIYLEGLQRLQGRHVSSAFQGFVATTPASGVSASLGMDVSVKRSPDNADLDLYHYALQPALHLPLAGNSVGLGAGFAQIGLAGQLFRSARSLQLDWTAADPQGHWAVMVDRADRAHRPELSDLDACVYTLMLQRHQLRPLSWLTDLDLGMHLGRERSASGFAELSSRSLALQVSVRGLLASAQWSVGGVLNHVRFDASALADEPARSDRSVGLDLSVELPVGKTLPSGGQVLRLAYNLGRNHSNTRLYENQYQQLVASLRLNW